KSWNQAMELKFQGYKPIAGLRDGYSALVSFGLHFGLMSPSRYKNLFSTVHEAYKHSETLAKAGITPGLDPTRVQGIDPSIATNVMTDLSKSGFKWSLQPQVYKYMHSLVYLESTKWVSNEITKLKEGKIDRNKFERRISLDRL